ncbi:MAG: hypothetical protein KDJ35_01410 [Alphaproteobacteria bacterium]|nr:hypothetical protein [Alphaproteobacteria bacterium]
MSLPLIKYVLTGALRDRLLLSLIILLILGSSLSVFLGSGAVIEKNQFSLVFAAGGLRVCGMIGLVLFVVFFMRRSFESRDIDYLLSRPLGRVQFLSSYAGAFSILALLVSAAQTLCLYIVEPSLFGEGHILWALSLLVENIIMVHVGLFFSMVLTSAAGAAMVSFGFYVLARMMGQILGIIDHGKTLHDLEIFETVMQFISAVTPRLDLMGQTSWLLYGPGSDIGLGFILAQGVVFVVLILLAAMLDLIRRQF